MKRRPLNPGRGKVHLPLQFKILCAMILVLHIAGVSIGHSKNTITHGLNSYRDGDNLDRTRVSYIQPGAPARDMIWDSDNAAILGQYVSLISVVSDTVRVSTRDAEYHYRENSDSLSLIGYENKTSKILYDIPRLIRPSDMQYGDSISGYYSGKGVYCGKLHLDIAGLQYSVADACGVIIADGDTIRDVLRVHCHREEVLSPRDKASSGIVSADSARAILAKMAPQVIEDSWLWFADGCRYPVMETVEIHGNYEMADDDNPGFTYLFLPYSQTMTLASDNDNINRRQTRRIPSGSTETDEGASPAFPVDADMTLSDDGRTVTISYHQNFKGEVKFVVCDTRGRLLCSVSRSGDIDTHDLSLDLMRPPVGNVVVVRLEANGMTMSRKVYKETF